MDEDLIAAVEEFNKIDFTPILEKDPFKKAKAARPLSRKVDCELRRFRGQRITYILELAGDPEPYWYVGISENVSLRMKNHFKVKLRKDTVWKVKKGKRLWTWEHPPVRLVSLERGDLEGVRTCELIKRYGLDRVRGHGDAWTYMRYCLSNGKMPPICVINPFQPDSWSRPNRFRRGRRDEKNPQVG